MACEVIMARDAEVNIMAILLWYCSNRHHKRKANYYREGRCSTKALSSEILTVLACGSRQLRPYCPMVFDINGVQLDDKLQNGKSLASCSATNLSSSCSTNSKGRDLRQPIGTLYWWAYTQKVANKPMSSTESRSFLLNAEFRSSSQFSLSTVVSAGFI